jgi:hypothetical protein
LRASILIAASSQIIGNSSESLFELPCLQLVGANNDQLDIILRYESSDALGICLMLFLLLIVLHLLFFASHFVLFSDIAGARLELTRGQQLVEVVKVEHLSILVNDCH